MLYVPDKAQYTVSVGFRRLYPSDLTDEQWAAIAPFIPPSKSGSPNGGRKREVEMREVLNAILYFLSSGCQWRMLPHDFPRREVVRYYYDQWREDGTWQHLHDLLRSALRLKVGKEERPSAAIIDSQTVKTTEEGGVRGYDAGKKINGRKRHLMVDTLGLLMTVVVHAASIQDRDGARLLIERARTTWFSTLKILWADAAYSGHLVEWAKERYQWFISIIKKLEGQTEFHVQAKRWIVERTFGWLNRYRRLSKDYERLVVNSETMITIAMTRVMLRRLIPT